MSDSLPDVIEVCFVPRAGCHRARDRIVASTLGTEPERLRWRISRYGRPELIGAGGVDCNLSHTGPLAAIAVARGRRVGVDVETVRRDTPVGALAARFFPADQASYVGEDPGRFYRLWTRKEACVKAIGGKLAQSLALPVLTTGAVSTSTGALAGRRWFVVDVPAPGGGVLASVAAVGPRPFAVRVKQSGIPLEDDDDRI